MSGEVSPAAMAANRRLHELRAQLAASRAAANAGDDRRPASAPPEDTSHSLPVTARQSPEPGGVEPAANPILSGGPSPEQGQGETPVGAAGRGASGLASGAPRAPSCGRHRPPATIASGGRTRPANLPPDAQPAGQGEANGASHSESVPLSSVPLPTTSLPIPEAAAPPAWPAGHSPSPGPRPDPAGPVPAAPGAAPSITELVDRIAALPPHLGWGSEALTAHLRKLRITNYELRIQTPATGDPPLSLNAERVPLNSSLVTRHSSLVKVYPAIALAMLRQERVAAGRVWLLLRHLDSPGRGCVELDAARAALCDRASPLRLCGRRRLRQLLAEGEGLFWQREARAGGPDRLWLRGPARVAAALGVARLAGRPVGVPVAALLGGMGDARAHLYATFHSGRAREVANEEASPHASFVTPHASLGMPIARDTLADLSGVCPRSQTAYERRAGVASRANIALGERVPAAAPAGPVEQERAWRQGRALFRLRDHRGLHGRAGATYLAWQLPNAYGPARGHQPRPRGQQKRINRQLADLFTKGMTGNGAERIEKRFFGTAVAAVKGQGSGGGREQTAAARYWPLGRGQGHSGVWGALEPVRGRRRPPAAR